MRMPANAQYLASWMYLGVQVTIISKFILKQIQFLFDELLHI